MERSELSLNTVFSANRFPIRQPLAALFSQSCGQYTKPVSKCQFAFLTSHKILVFIGVRP
jgi:hypothetical protein